MLDLDDHARPGGPPMTTPSSDEKLRDLERRFRQTGSPDDEAAWLLERVRVGDLTHA